MKSDYRLNDRVFVEAKNKNASKVNRFIPFFLVFLFAVLLLPQISYPDSTLADWLNSAEVNGFYWLAVGVATLLFAFLVWHKNRVEIPLRYGLMFIWILLFTLLIALLHESSFRYADGQGLIQTFRLTPLARLAYEAKRMDDLLFCFAFLFLFSYAKDEPKYKNVVLYAVVLFALASAIYAFIKGPDTSGSYLVYTSFFTSNVDFGKVLFASTFASALLAYDHPGVLRYVFMVLTAGFIALSGVFALAITFWSLILASFVVGLAILLNQKAKSKALKIGCLLYVLLIATFIALIAIPSWLADTLRLYFGNELATLFSERIALWSRYLNSLSSWRIFLGDGALGHYRISLTSASSPVFTSLENGVLEVYDNGGLVYLMFYFLAIIVGAFRYMKREEKSRSFFAIVLAFSCAFLIFTFFSDERLFFSSHFLSLFLSTILLCYPHHPDSLIDGE